MKCNNCGSEIESGLIYCPNCGQSIQLVPNYNVLEEELLSKLVEDKDSGAKDKFATGVYKPVKVEDTADDATESEASVAKVSFKIERSYVLLICVVVILIVSVIVGFVTINNSKSYDYLIDKAEEMEAKSSFSDAADYYKLAYEQNDTSFEAIFGLGRMYYMAKEYNSSIEALSLALTLDPESVSAYEYLAQSYIGVDNKQAVYELYNDAPNERIKQAVSQYIIAPPEFSLEPGTYDEEIVLFITSKDNYQIFYSLDGKDPTKYGKLYKESIKFDDDGEYTVKAVCLSPDGQYSYPLIGEYIVTVEKVPIPEPSAASGQYTYPLCLTFNVPSGYTCYYTLNGSNPTTKSEIYSDMIIMPFGQSTLKAILVSKDGKESEIFKGDYDCELAEQ